MKKKVFYTSFLLFFLFLGVVDKLFINSAYSLDNQDASNIKLKNMNENYYILGPGDILSLTVYDANDFSGNYTIMSDGKIFLPLIGSVDITKLTLDQATTKIKKLYSIELLRPEILLSLFKSRPVKVSVTGEITNPGLYSLTFDELTQTKGNAVIKNTGIPTIINAIQKAGGITNNSNLREVSISRLLPGKDIAYKQTTVNLIDLILKGDQSQNFILFDGDIISIKKAEKLSEEIIEASSANLSPKVINVNVIGEVVSPGNLALMANTPVLQAVMQAGGPVPYGADKTNIQLVRINRNGSMTLRKYRLDLKQGVSEELNPPLLDGDIVYVNSSILAKVNRGIGAVTQPMTGLVTALSLFKLIN